MNTTRLLERFRSLDVDLQDALDELDADARRDLAISARDCQPRLPWRFDVYRRPDGLIDYVIAKPINETDVPEAGERQ